MSDEIRVGDWAELVNPPKDGFPHPDGTRNLERGEIIRVDGVVNSCLFYDSAGKTCLVLAERWKRFDLRPGDRVVCISGELDNAWHPAGKRLLKRGDVVTIDEIDARTIKFLLLQYGYQWIPRTSILPLPRTTTVAVVACTCTTQQLLWGGHTCGLPNTAGTTRLS